MSGESLSERDLHGAARALAKADPDEWTLEAQAVHAGRQLLAEVHRLRDERVALHLALAKVRANTDGVAEIGAREADWVQCERGWTTDEISAFEAGWREGRMRLPGELLGERQLGE